MSSPSSRPNVVVPPTSAHYSPAPNANAVNSLNSSRASDNNGVEVIEIIAPPPISSHPMVTRSRNGIFKPKALLSNYCLPSALLSELEPKTVKVAMTNPKWLSAMTDEFEALQRNNTWTLVPAEENMNVVGSKWVFRTKFNLNGSILKHKARLVAKGFHQTAGLDFFDTYSPVVKPSTIRVLFALAVFHNWDIQQVDINNAFLNGTLKSRFLCNNLRVLRILPSHLLSANLIKPYSSLFILKSGNDILYLLVYMDDILIFGNNSTLIQHIIAKLNNKFALKTLGSVSYFLGFEAYMDSTSLFLTQAKYTVDLLKRMSMFESNASDTPLSASSKLTKNGVPLENATLYRSTIGQLAEIVCTWEGISFSGALENNKLWPDQTKHIDIDTHFIREKVSAGIVEPRYVPTEFQATDILTKALPAEKFRFLCSKLNHIDSPQFSLMGDVRVSANMSSREASHQSYNSLLYIGLAYCQKNDSVLNQKKAKCQLNKELIDPGG
ncbi:hypothetical protein Q3G72_027410 [Acer saccharum]|nr:hypothetical protein Q3G72_027410 [Acer saccharum]